jgi:hypothetical protein
MRLDLAVAKAECGTGDGEADVAAAHELLGSDILPGWSGTVELARARMATALGDVEAAYSNLNSAIRLFGEGSNEWLMGTAACALVGARLHLLRGNLEQSLAQLKAYLSIRASVRAVPPMGDLGLPSADSRLIALSAPIFADVAAAGWQAVPELTAMLWLQASISFSSAGNILDALAAGERAVAASQDKPDIRYKCQFQRDRAAAVFKRLLAAGRTQEEDTLVSSSFFPYRQRHLSESAKPENGGFRHHVNAVAAEQAIAGHNPVTALCGWTWIPQLRAADDQNCLPICPGCQAIYDVLPKA